MKQICPLCRSTLEAHSHADFNAPSLQKLSCPVCSIPIWLSSGFPIPQKFDYFSVTTRIEPAISYSEFKKDNPTVAKSLETLPAQEASQSVYKDFSILDSVSNLGNNISTGFKIGAGVIIAIAILALIIYLKKK